MTRITDHDFVTTVTDLGACKDALVWLSSQSDAKTAWASCHRGDWMLWLLGRLDKSAPWSEEHKPLVRCVIACASAAIRYATNDTITAQLWCLDALTRWCNGEANRDEVEAAVAAAASAAAAAYAVYYAAYAAVSASAASAADYSAFLKESADIVRRHFPAVPLLAVQS